MRTSVEELRKVTGGEGCFSRVFKGTGDLACPCSLASSGLPPSPTHIFFLALCGGEMKASLALAASFIFFFSFSPMGPNTQLPSIHLF